MRQKHSHNFLHGQKYMIKAKKLSHQLWRNEEAQEQRGDREEGCIVRIIKVMASLPLCVANCQPGPINQDTKHLIALPFPLHLPTEA